MSGSVNVAAVRDVLGFCDHDLSMEDHKVMARAHASLVVDVLTRRTRAWHLYTPDDLALHASRCVTHCRLFALKGGKPWE